MNNKVILGTCSICGGRVSVASVTWSTSPPSFIGGGGNFRASCENCGAYPKTSYGPTIEMIKQSFPSVSPVDMKGSQFDNRSTNFICK